MGILVATAARPQNIHFDERLTGLSPPITPMASRKSIAKVAMGRKLAAGLTGRGEENGTIGGFERSVHARESYLPGMV
jgi:hypothetical protein